MIIERPPKRKYCITDKELFQISVNVEKQGGSKSEAWKTNLILDEIVRRVNK